MSFDDNKLPEGTLKMCPKFVEWNKQCEIDLLNRYSKHNKHRSKCIKLCVDETLYELYEFFNIKLLSETALFIEKDDILYKSINEMNYLICKTSTVQASKCKKQILTYQAFIKKANNKQDQNSWKISGEYFFSPYIELFIKFMKNNYLLLLPNTITNIQKEKIFELSCIIFAIKLLTKTVKFDRAKEKPLIRDRTLVNSSSLHYAFKKLNYKLNLPKFYTIEKAKRKKIKKKIISQEFHYNICQYAKYLLNIIKNGHKNVNINDYNFPYDWINNKQQEQQQNNDDEDDDDDDDIISNSDYYSENDTDNTSDNNSVNINENNNNNNNNINNNRIFQNTSNFNNLSNGINKGSLCIDLDIKREKKRKINQEIHINQMKIIPIIPINQLNNELVFDIQPTSLNCIGSETIINGDMYTNDMGYSFSK